MSDKVTALYREGKIDKYEYDTFILFEGNDVGRNYLRNMFEAIVLEEPDHSKSESYAWIDGRRSTWRQVKIVINMVNNLLENNTDVTNRNNYNPEFNPDCQPLRTFYPPDYT